MAIRTTSYREALLENLADPEEATLYLEAVLEDYPEGYAKASGNVAQAQLMARLVEDIGTEAVG